MIALILTAGVASTAQPASTPFGQITFRLHTQQPAAVSQPTANPTSAAVPQRTGDSAAQTLIAANPSLNVNSAPEVQSQIRAALAAYWYGYNVRAMEILKPLAESGVPAAQYVLGVLYNEAPRHLSNGTVEHRADDDFPRGTYTGVRLIMLAAKGGLPEATEYLKKILPLEANQVRGELDSADSFELQQNYNGANQIWESLTDMGVAEAQYKLGRAYALGRGVPKDNEAAKKWITLAANQGYSDAIETLKVSANPPPSHAQACQGLAAASNRVAHEPNITPADKADLIKKYSINMARLGCN
jgi:TPR repeat protein